ncbi:outer membrane protein OmpA-like peptidoglycan-associated protein [Pararhizobium capsulatum DSM 1112]|uniref:Outer membrane protein OmpA-like peptidoglycan-associated protein n=1 Tax=Pararhizobium capsulatum DSM 1112 TaxID=1121113 RepID=A0ABU0BQG2_9HYPH|nr:OmpA family protein [Pararhizobium capsulatum]MDQ0320491.1 outer membrane protein OmpA-like peptidoglycan-associated protein [Pararhizobium capsulatum DSM 1112]
MLGWLIGILGDVGNALNSVGPFRSVVTTVLAVIATGILLFTLLFRAWNFSPPFDAKARRFAEWWAMIASVIVVVAIYLYHQRDPIGMDLTPVALTTCFAAFATLVVYVTLSYFMTFTGLDGERHIKGLWLDPLSKKVLKGDLADLPEERMPQGPLPRSPEDFFNGSGGNEPFVWTRMSLFLASAILLTLYFVMSIGFVGGLSALATEVGQAEARIEIGSTVLFEVDSAKLRPDALSVLAAEFRRIGAFHARRVHIVGHTDETSSEDHNQKLSHERADAVRAWMLAQPSGQPMTISAEGRGVSEPLVAEKGLSGAELTNARRLNRRVEIFLSR